MRQQRSRRAHASIVDDPISRMLDQTAMAAPIIRETLEHIPVHLLALTAEAGTRIVQIAEDDLFTKRSPELARIRANTDGAPIRPTGIFVLAERTIYLRKTFPFTIAHEFGHALDFALGSNGCYLSENNEVIQSAFQRARRYITPYAVNDEAEYFAECFRAMLEANNIGDAEISHYWKPATRARLRAIDPTMYAYFKALMRPPSTITEVA